MIELMNDSLCFLFPNVHPDARLDISFIRTLRVPDDGSRHPTPPDLGTFPMLHVDDFERTVPSEWIERGGVMLPMYRSEALMVRFSPRSIPHSRGSYPFAIKLAAGKINALTGEEWTNQLTPYPQDYIVSPPQDQVDGYCVEKGVVRQFVAMPLGLGQTAEEQISHTARYGGIQVCAYPMKVSEYEQRIRQEQRDNTTDHAIEPRSPFETSMGLGLGGWVEQGIRLDPYDHDVWDHDNMSRCFIHLMDSALWSAITDQMPPDPPPRAREYNLAGIPWHDSLYTPTPEHEGSRLLKQLLSVEEQENRPDPL